MRILCVGAHPDDVELGMAGTIIKHKERDEVHLLLCTSGGVCGDPKVREEEARAAARIMNVDDLHILNYPVSKLNDANEEFTDILKKVITDLAPDRVYVHFPLDMHQVHVTVSNSTVKASKHVRQIVFYETISSTTTDFKPNAYVDVTNFIDLKIKCIEAHRTQSHRVYLQPNVIRSAANFRYIQGKVGSNPDGYAEAFRIYRMII